MTYESICINLSFCLQETFSFCPIFRFVLCCYTTKPLPLISISFRFSCQFLGQFQSSYNEIRKNPNFDKICQEESIRQKLISLLETMRGITSATNRKNAEMIFQFLSTYLTDIPYLLEKYANCPDIVELIFELFVDVVRTEIIYLDRVRIFYSIF